MSTRADLLKAAADAAAAAASTTGPLARREHADAAKVALEAAALAEGMPPDEIAAALDGMREQLEAAGLGKACRELEPAAFLEYLLGVVGDWRALVASREGYIGAFERLRVLCDGLERDFLAGDTETSRRLAARVRAAVDEADHLLPESED